VLDDDGSGELEYTEIDNALSKRSSVRRGGTSSRRSSVVS
jgi:hypothetical protein